MCTVWNVFEYNKKKKSLLMCTVWKVFKLKQEEEEEPVDVYGLERMWI